MKEWFKCPEQLARRCWMPLLGAAVLFGLLIIGANYRRFALQRLFAPGALDHLMGICMGLAILFALLGCSCLFARLFMPDRPPSHRSLVVYVLVVLLFSVSNFIIHLHLGHTNWQDHSLLVLPWTTTGQFSMLLTRVFFENGPWSLWPILPFGLITHACLWLPALFRGKGYPAWLRPLILQILWLLLWVGVSYALAPVTYTFYV